MSTSASPEPANVTSMRAEEPAAQGTPDVMREIIACNAASKAHEDLWSRTRQAADMTSQATTACRNAVAEQEEAELAYKARQAEDPERSAPCPRQWLIAGGTLALDGLACYFAAEALGAGQLQTLAWAALFLALLGAGEVVLDHFRDSHRAAWRWVAFILGGFIGLLGVLRYSFLVTVGAEGFVAAGAGASLFTVATAGFVIIGYRALRAAETGPMWKARRHAGACAKAAAAAHRGLERQIARRDRLARAYLNCIRARLVLTCTDSQIQAMERAVWAHLVEGNLS
jgi:hypothetical protein